MGANYIEREFAGTLTPSEAEAKIQLLIEESLSEDGRSYSGNIGMVSGITMTDKVFPTEEEAHEYLIEHTEKWEDAVAVKYSVANSEPVRTIWLIGAVCAE